MADVIALADVIAMFCVLSFCWGRCFYLTIEYVTCVNKYVLWHMFQTTESDVFLPLLYMLGWCYCLLLLYVDDVIPHGLLHFFFWVGWCYCLMAGGIATTGWYMADVTCQMADGICHCRVQAGRCYGQQADVIALVNFYNFSSEMLSRTSSQICGRWYLPMFLFRDGSLTLIYRASLMVLVRFWSSLPTISKFSILILWPGVL